MPKTKVVTPEQFREQVTTARDKMLTQYSPVVEDVVARLIDGQVEKMVLGVLGLEKRWDRWEMSYNNGKDTPMLLAIKDKAEQVAGEVVEQALAEPITLSAAQIASIRKVYRDTVIARLKDIAEHVASRDAAHYVEEVLDVPADDRSVEETLTQEYQDAQHRRMQGW